MNVFQYTDAIDSLLAAHAAGLISNENLSQGGAELDALYKLQPESAKVGGEESPRIVAEPDAAPAAERLRELFALDDGDAAEAAQDEAERKAWVAAEIEGSKARTMASLAELEAAGGFQQAPISGRAALSRRIDHIAAGDYWDESALREALAQPGIPAELAAACRRSMSGTGRSTDHIALCDLGIWLRQTPSEPTEAFDDKAPKAGDKYRYYGRDFTVLASFPETLEGTRAANAFMAAHPNAGVLNIDGGRVILADNNDKGA